ncbi:MAG: hypothetical protein JNM17_18920 [Archangium sp.]|nr:hypothetical protein [Archangium sp.]
MASFRVLHEQNKRGALGPLDKNKYLAMRDELARSLMESSGQEMPAGNIPPRRIVKVAQLFNIELSNLYKTMTRELSCQGFVTLVQGSFRDGDRTAFVLSLGRSVDPVQGDAIVKSALKQAGNTTRLVCEFTALKEPALERIEEAVFDAALLRIK